jgi:hypothetical protein
VAGQCDEAITGHCGFTSNTVHLFEKLHFNVRDRLDATDWAAVRVIGPGLWRGFTQQELGKIWMSIAFFGGPLALDALNAATVETGEIAFPKPGDKCRHSSAEEAVRQKILLAVGALLPADAPLRQLGQLYGRMRRSEISPKHANVTKKISADVTPVPAGRGSASRTKRNNNFVAMARSQK